MSHRIERDSLGPVHVPTDALYGAQTQRAVENFQISGQRFGRRFIGALGLIKRACAEANRALGVIEADMADAIAGAATEVSEGVHDDHFPVDIYQTGSGTSSNMNTNEVIASRASTLLGSPVHPNDHVNASQSSNDVIPTAIHVSGAMALHEDLLPALRALTEALQERSDATADVVKSGRTHWMDATPITLGQELGAHAAQVRESCRRAAGARDALLSLALGGTAVGSGLNRHADFPALAITAIGTATGLHFVEAANHFEAQAAQDRVVEAHGALNTIAVSLTKIANDLRILASGPRTGLAEIRLPAVQPGSSIMPGKVNPVIPEMVVLVGARVFGNQATVTALAAGGSLQLNTGLPLLAHCLLESIQLLSAAATTLAERCVRGLEPDRERARETVERNLSLCTALAPVLGYDAAAALSKEALATSRSIREVALDRTDLSPAELDRLLDPLSMTGQPD